MVEALTWATRHGLGWVISYGVAAVFTAIAFRISKFKVK